MHYFLIMHRRGFRLVAFESISQTISDLVSCNEIRYLYTAIIIEYRQMCMSTITLCCVGSVTTSHVEYRDGTIMVIIGWVRVRNQYDTCFGTVFDTFYLALLLFTIFYRLFFLYHNRGYAHA